MPLQHLAKIYQKSAAGMGRAQSSTFRIDYEKFLRSAGLADGDEREIAEQKLRSAEARSGKLLRIDRNPKSHEPERIRLTLPDGELWLFEQIGTPSPTQLREDLARVFEQEL
ncbi:hypothetical protein HW115_05205 [Verrucomicrobiaceae bacterium N1E253]|uniref:Uncharacterized protein n=1 Tax=Oceaniferula marina TaxID=2748318 RepID=A0A851GIG0_9BACT|nr:hypothetical protein [Oceaniferula marina]NWK54995.1 hypothetical protein [Oceaniferula marina]